MDIDVLDLFIRVNSVARDSHKSYYTKHISNPGVLYLK